MNSLKDIYTLEDIDRAGLRGIFSGSQLKKFVQQDRYFQATDEEVVDITEEEYLAAAERKAKELAEEEAQARALEHRIKEIKEIKNSTEVNKPLEHKQRLMIQLPRISEYRKKQYVQFPDNQGDKDSDGEAQL